MNTSHFTKCCHYERSNDRCCYNGRTAQLKDIYDGSDSHDDSSINSLIINRGAHLLPVTLDLSHEWVFGHQLISSIDCVTIISQELDYGW